MTNSYVAKLLKAVARSKRGATAVEYGLIAALIANQATFLLAVDPFKKQLPA